MSQLTELEKTNVTIIDDQHAEIIAIVNLYFDSSDKNPESFIAFIQKLRAAVNVHFETEEKLMKESKYENYYSHKQEHDRFLRKINHYTFDNKESLFEFIRDWLSNHLIMKDLKLGKFLVENCGRVV